MATSSYMAGRKKYARPQAMLWADNPGTLIDGVYVPDGYELNSSLEVINSEESDSQFIILSDDNRGPIEFQIERIERRERMLNGRMRSYHVADKLSIDVSWEMLPSRSFAASPDFDENGESSADPASRTPGIDGSFEIIPNTTNLSEQYTSDGGAGGVELLDWYENHEGSFWVYLAYDKYTNFEESRYAKLQTYNQIIEMYIADFSYSVVKRGSNNHDFWNVSVTLEEA
jgi:hypothetical protein